MPNVDVGFALQADVFAGSSLLHFATGRLLKALSDGGVDTFAVATAVQLGTTINISLARATEVTTLIHSRKGRAGLFNKLLYIGWGHSEVASELAKTRAGAAALVTLGALATGSTVFMAAEAFTELLKLAGCPSDMLPSVDVVKPLIAYLSPFVADTGFRKVFTSVVTKVRSRCHDEGRKPPPGLDNIGDVEKWTRALHQMIFTASRNEDMVLVVEQRGAWLAAFGSYILGMAVQLYLGNNLVWESAGDQGKAIIHLDSVSHEHPMIQNFLLVPPARTTNGGQPLYIDYQLDEALETEILLEPRICPILAKAIKTAIVRLLVTMTQNIRMKTVSIGLERHPINGHFGVSASMMRSVCRSMGIEDAITSFAQDTALSPNNAKQCCNILEQSFSHMDGKNVGILRQACDVHVAKHSYFEDQQCLCTRVTNLIHAFASTAAALLLCDYDNMKTIRVSSQVVSGDTATDWSRRLIPHSYHTVTMAHAMMHLSHLTHGTELVGNIGGDPSHSLLAVSAGSTTIYCKAILDTDAFDDQGRVLAIVSGRLSVRGVLRKTVVEPLQRLQHDWYTEAPVTKLANRSLVCPGFAQGPMVVDMSVNLTETEIVLQCVVKSQSRPGLPPVPISLLQCVEKLMLVKIGKPCPHSRNKPYAIDANVKPYFIASFFASPVSCCYSRPEGGPQFYATSGRRLEQIIQMSRIDDHEISCQTIYQGQSCLACAERKLEISYFTHKNIIMS